MVDGKKCTIMDYVDDTKISDMNPLVIDNMLELLESNLGNFKS